MENKEDLINRLNNSMNTTFVDQYDEIMLALKDVNEYLSVLDIDYVYTYDVFCNEFIVMAKSFIEKLSMEELNNMNIFTFVQEIIATMIYWKISELVENEEEKRAKLLQHILIKKNT
jgi:hypothetical protein